MSTSAAVPRNDGMERELLNHGQCHDGDEDDGGGVVAFTHSAANPPHAGISVA
jgi:hypothetical protein